MEQEPDTQNVLFIDEYPEIIARREVKLALGGLRRIVNSDHAVLEFPNQPTPPDDAA